MKINAQITAIIAPMTHDGMPNAFWQLSPMELAWTIVPMKPRARTMAIAKKPAMNLPKALLNAFLI